MKRLLLSILLLCGFVARSQTAAVTVNTSTRLIAYPTNLWTINRTGISNALGLTIGGNVQGYDAELAALAGVTSAADTLPYFTGSGTASTTGLSSFMRTLLDDADAATARTTLGISGGGSVTSVSVTTANGVSGSVANPTTTPAITLSLGAITPNSVALAGTAGSGFVSFPSQSSAPSTPASGFVEYADSSGRVSWKRASDGFVRTIASTLTADRVYTWPDAATTVPIVSQQLTFSGPTASRTVTLPDASFSAARTDAAQTFSGVQTFGGGAIYIGSSVGTAPYIFSFSGNSDGSPNAAGLGLTIYNYATGNTEYGVSFRGASILATAGDSRAIHMSRIFAPTSGSATWSQLSVQAAVNQTGGASGVTRNLFVNSVITAAADHRALEVAGGKSYFTYSPASGEAAARLNGTWFTGGTATTTKPLVLIEPTGTTSTGWSTSGTGVGINAASGFAGNLLDAQLAGATKFSVNASGDILVGGDTPVVRNAANDIWIRNAANPMSLSIANSYTSGTSYEVGRAYWTGNVFVIGTEKGSGGGSARAMTFTTGGSPAWQIDTSGNLIPLVSTRNFGAPTTRPGEGYFGTALNVGPNGADISITGEASGVLQLGNDSATPATQYIHGPDGSGSNIAGGTLQLGGGRGTGTGVGGSTVIVGSPAGGAGSVTNAAVAVATFTGAGDVQFQKTVIAAGTTGAQTINKTMGRVNFAAAATSLVVTDSLVTANSIILATVASNDATMKSVAVVAGSGSFTLFANAAPTTETAVNFLVFN